MAAPHHNRLRPRPLHKRELAAHPGRQSEGVGGLRVAGVCATPLDPRRSRAAPHRAHLAGFGTSALFSRRGVPAAGSIARLRLANNQYSNLLNVQTTGAFFRASPQMFYGSTIMGFLASFGLLRAMVHVTDYDESLFFGTRRLANEANACKMTGFLPIHCAVANGQLRMYDCLTGARNHLALVPGECRVVNSQVVNSDLRTTHSNFEQWSGLTPLQLAAKLGDNRMCQHILRKRLKLNWKWGPLKSYRMSLEDIDSVSRVAHPSRHGPCERSHGRWRRMANVSRQL